eukprot:3419871-Rhodomonas_salina.4
MLTSVSLWDIAAASRIRYVSTGHRMNQPELHTLCQYRTSHRQAPLLAGSPSPGSTIRYVNTGHRIARA